MKIQKEFFDNDVYFLQTISDRILVNDNYNGILIYDFNLKLINKIFLFDQMVISSSINNNSQILLFCEENECIVYINLNSFKYKVIDARGFDNIFFKKLYLWEEKKVFLEYSMLFWEIDLIKGTIQSLNKDYVNKYQPSFFEESIRLNKFQIYKLFLSERKLITRKDRLNLNISNLTQTITDIFEFEEEQYHDFEMLSDVFIKISESKVQVIKESQVYTNIYAATGYYYLTGKIMQAENVYWVYLLRGNCSNEMNTIIERYCIN